MESQRQWLVCLDEDGAWRCVCTHESQAEAEAHLRKVRLRIPNAFLAYATWTRIDQHPARPTPTLTLV